MPNDWLQLDSGWVLKPTIQHWDSATPLLQKRGIVIARGLALADYSLRFVSFLAALKDLGRHLFACGHPLTFIYSCFYRVFILMQTRKPDFLGWCPTTDDYAVYRGLCRHRCLLLCL